MYEQISSNKRKSYFLILFFLVLVFLLAWAFGQLTDLGHYAVILAVIIAVAMTFGSYYYSDKIVLAVSRARPVEEEGSSLSLQCCRGIGHCGWTTQAALLHYR